MAESQTAAVHRRIRLLPGWGSSEFRLGTRPESHRRPLRAVVAQDTPFPGQSAKFPVRRRGNCL